MKRLLKHLICVFFLIFAAAPASAFQKDNITINVDGKQRSIVLFTPNNVGSGLPVMIVTHGMNQNTTYQLEGDHFSELVDSERFILAYLESDGGTWDIGGSKDLNFVDATINYLDNRFHVDRNRLYWSGFSMGSMLIYHAIRSEIGKKFAAFAPCSGILFTAEPWNQRTTPVNLIHCHAKPDDVFNYNIYNINFDSKYVEG
jgi:poly(3-hydroxybutyrate) depolymerase